MRGVSIGRCLADDLVQSGDSLQNFEPTIHAQRQHSLFDRGLLDLGGARALHDQLSQSRSHVENFVQPLTTTEARSVTLFAALSAEEGEIFHAAIQGYLLHERLGRLSG